MKKIFTGVLLCIFMLSSIAFAKPAVDFNSGNKRLDISGVSDVKSGVVTVCIVNKSNVDNVFSDTAAFADSLMLFHHINTNSEGVYSGKFALPTYAAPGNYSVYVSGDDECSDFYYADASEISRCISDFELATIDNIATTIENYTVIKNILGTKPSEEFYRYESYANKAMIELLQSEIPLDINKIISCLEKAAEAGVLMGGTKEEVEAALTANTLDIAIDSSISNGDLSDMLISVREKEPITEDEDVLDYIPALIKNASAIIAVNSATKGEMTNVLEKYKQTLDLTDYKKYVSFTDDADRIKVNKYLTNQDFGSLTELRKAFKNGMNSLSNEGKKPSSSGGSPSAGKVTAQYQTSDSNISPSAKFNDLYAVPWAQSAINNLVNLGIVSGYENNEYRPMQNVTRAEYTKLIMGINSKNSKNLSNDIGFSDVDKSDWFYDIIILAAKEGVVYGNDGFFYPNNNITREDAAVMIYRIVKGLGTFDTKKTFLDMNSVSDYAAEAVSLLAGAGFINGIGDGNFAPKALLTRAEAAVMINSVLNYLN